MFMFSASVFKHSFKLCMMIGFVYSLSFQANFMQFQGHGGGGKIKTKIGVYLTSS